jgi:hypothetical protein
MRYHPGHQGKLSLPPSAARNRSTPTWPGLADAAVFEQITGLVVARPYGYDSD